MQYTPYSFSYPVSWNIKKDAVFRILDDIQWMENFFESGEIMLSCFNKFRKYPDEMQGDINEGEAIVGGFDEKNNKHNYVIYESGMKAFILSTTSEITEKVKKDFNGKCAIKINNPTLFGLEISKKLPFVNSGLEGACNYAPTRIHLYEKELKENKIFQNIDFQNNPNRNEIFAEITLGMELFLKLDKYKHQKEYRLIWFSKQPVNESIMIKCPEAIEFCEKIYF